MLLAEKFFTAAPVVQIATPSNFLHHNWDDLEIDQRASATPTAPFAGPSAGHQ
jgi:hypothetical protein